MSKKSLHDLATAIVSEAKSELKRRKIKAVFDRFAVTRDIKDFGSRYLVEITGEIDQALLNRLASRIVEDIANNTEVSNNSIAYIFNSLRGSLNKGVKTNIQLQKITKGKDTVERSVISKTIKKNKKSPVSPMSQVKLLRQINARLHNALKENMTLPALVYRTGRFARSVKATRATFDKEGKLTIFYTYQMDPYQVFERNLGKLPWNIPSRDPVRLISKTIREITTDMALLNVRTSRLTVGMYNVDDS